VSVVVVGAALDQPGLHRQHRHSAVQRLDLGLLIHAQHDRVLRRSQVQPADVGDLPDQFGVGGEPERLRLPRLDPVGPPRTLDRRRADLEPRGQQPARPMGDAQLLRRRLQRLRHDRSVVQRPRPPRPGNITQTSDPSALISTPPVQDGGDRRVGQLRDPNVRHTVRGQQHDPRPLRRRCPNLARPRPPLELLTITRTKNQSRSRTIRHTPMISDPKPSSN